MYDFLDKIGLKAVLEAIKAKMPKSLPADGGNADTVSSLKTYSESYQDIFSVSLAPTHPCWNKICSVTGQSSDPNADDYVDNSPESGVLVWYEVETIGSFSRAYQIAHGCYSHQRKSFIRYMHDGFWSDWEEISTTPIKSSVFGMTTNGQAWVDTGLPVATTKIISVLCSTQSMVGHVWQLDGYSTWCASFYYTSNVATPVPNTPVSFTIYYFEE